MGADGERASAGLLSVRCPRCATRLELPPSALGRRLRCGACKTVFRQEGAGGEGDGGTGEAEPAVPRRFGPYRVERLLGRGGMGSVYLGRDERLDRPVAIKVLARHLARDREFLLRFEREARALANLEHENVTRVYFMERGDPPFFAMEYVEGMSLDALLQARGRLPCGDALRIALHVARALEAADAHRIVHRDVKPANVLVRGRDGLVKVTDFGLAKALEGASSLTSASVVLGTPQYMSPEQGRGEARIDGRSDQYGLGATLWHMLCGAPPFDGGNPTEIVLEHINAPLPALLDLRPEVGAPVAAVVERMLAKDPDRRHPDFPSLVRALEGLVATGAGRRSAAAPAPPDPSDSPTRVMDFVPVGAPGSTLVDGQAGSEARRDGRRRAGPLVLALLVVASFFLAYHVALFGPEIAPLEAGRVHMDFRRGDCPVPLLRVDPRRVRWLAAEGLLRVDGRDGGAVVLFALPLRGAIRLRCAAQALRGPGSFELGLSDPVAGRELRLATVEGVNELALAPLPGGGGVRRREAPLALLRRRVPRWAAGATVQETPVRRKLADAREGEPWSLVVEVGREGGRRVVASAGAGAETIDLPPSGSRGEEVFLWLRIRGRRLDLRELSVDCEALRPPFEPTPEGEGALRALHAFLRATGSVPRGR